MLDTDHQTAASTSGSGAYESLRQETLDHIWLQTGYSWDQANAPGGIKIMDRGEGSTLFDIEGKRYLDFTSGLWLANVGYGRTEIADAMAQQAGRLHWTKHQWPTESTVRAATKIAQLAPGDLTKVFFTTGGGEANEAAIKIALQYHYMAGNTDRNVIIGRRGSYHGASIATMSVGGASMFDRTMFEANYMPNAKLISTPGPTISGRTAAEELEEAILAVGRHRVAAFIGEPISNSAGIHVPDCDYWPMIREICTKHGVLLICDEVVTGFGRTGTMFGVEHWGIVPDLLTMAKGATSGYAPLGAVIAREEITERFRPSGAEAFQHVCTFGGHAVACAAAVVNLDILQRENLVKGAADKGNYFVDQLNTLSRHLSFKGVRGLGLMQCLQLSVEGLRGEGMTPESERAFGASLAKKIKDRGLVVGGSLGGGFKLLPPLVIAYPEIDEAVSILDTAIADAEREAIDGPMY